MLDTPPTWRAEEVVHVGHSTYGRAEEAVHAGHATWRQMVKWHLFLNIHFTFSVNFRQCTVSRWRFSLTINNFLDRSSVNTYYKLK